MWHWYASVRRRWIALMLMQGRYWFGWGPGTMRQNAMAWGNVDQTVTIRDIVLGGRIDMFIIHVFHRLPRILYDDSMKRGFHMPDILIYSNIYIPANNCLVVHMQVKIRDPISRPPISSFKPKFADQSVTYEARLWHDKIWLRSCNVRLAEGRACPGNEHQ